MVHPARLELTTFYSGDCEMPLKNEVLSSIKLIETSKNTEFWLPFWFPTPLANGAPVDASSSEIPTITYHMTIVFSSSSKTKSPPKRAESL